MHFQVTIDLWHSVADLDALIGPSCSTVCQPVSLLAAAWGIPLISWGCGSASLSNKLVHPTFTRVDSTWLSRIVAFRGLCNMFGWKKIGILSTPEKIYRFDIDLKSLNISISTYEKNKKVLN